MEIKSKYHGAVVLSEVPICTNPDVEKNLMAGIIDLLVVKDNGEIVIVDFKTSMGYNTSIS